MKIIIVLATLSVAMVCHAQSIFAADLLGGKYERIYKHNEPPEIPQYSQPLWAGFYMGLHFGAASAEADITDRFEYQYDPIARNDFRFDGTMAGGQIGYNLQSGNIVYGLEAALGGMAISGRMTDDDLRGPGDTIPQIGATYSISGDLYGELTARLGYSSGAMLLYLKGGRAFLQTRLDAHYEGDNWTTMNGCYTGGCNGVTPNKSVFDFSNSETLYGWTIGAGLEYALNELVSMKLEYQYFDFGRISYGYEGNYHIIGGGQSNLRGHLDADVTLDVVKLGINYRLQNAYRPLP